MQSWAGLGRDLTGWWLGNENQNKSRPWPFLSKIFDPISSDDKWKGSKVKFQFCYSESTFKRVRGLQYASKYLGDSTRQICILTHQLILSASGNCYLGPGDGTRSSILYSADIMLQWSGMSPARNDLPPSGPPGPHGLVPLTSWARPVRRTDGWTGPHALSYPRAW